MQDNPRKSYDAIVIGGGHNGLVTAAYLAKAGKSVCVLERRHVLGGCTVTEELWPGYKVSTAAYVVSLLLPEIMRELQLKHHGLAILPRRPSSFTPLLDGRSLTLGPDLAECQREIAKFSGPDAEAYPHYNQLLEDVAQVLEPVLCQAAPDPLPLPKAWRKIGVSKRARDAHSLWTLYRTLGQLGDRLPEAIELLLGAARPLLERWFEAEVLRATLATDAIIGAFASISSPGTAYVLLHHVMGTAGGARGVWGYVRGGMGGLADALAGACRQLNVEIRREASVCKILISRGRVQGVGLVDGSQLDAPVVASSIDANLTFQRLLDADQLPEPFRRAVARIDYASASAKINLALAEPPNFTCAPSSGIAPHHHGTMHISPTLEYLERAYDDAKYGQPSREPVLEITLPSSVDPTFGARGPLRDVHLRAVRTLPPGPGQLGRRQRIVRGSLHRVPGTLRTQRAGRHPAPTSGQPPGSGAHLQPDRGQYHAGGDDGRSAVRDAARARLGRSPHADQGPLPVRGRQSSRRRCHRCVRSERVAGDPAGLLILTFCP